VCAKLQLTKATLWRRRQGEAGIDSTAVGGSGSFRKIAQRFKRSCEHNNHSVSISACPPKRLRNQIPCLLKPHRQRRQLMMLTRMLTLPL
jgi:hypothetical protein